MRTALVLVAASVLLAACSTKRVAPVEERVPTASRPPTAAAPATPKPAPEPDWRPQTYTVKRGDTLYQIALDHGLDYRELVAWNAIDNANRILVGQVLRLSPPGAETAGTPDAGTGVVTAPLRAAAPVTESRAAPATTAAARDATSPAPTSRNTENYKVGPKAVKEPYSAQAARELAKAEPPLVVAKAEPSLPAPASPSTIPAPGAPPAPAAAERASPTPATPSAPVVVPGAPSSAGGDDDDGIEWIWPTKGKVVGTYSDAANLKGLDIAGTPGQPVVAAAPGKVVYAGSGLRGYGKLVIIKHNRNYLSAYAHNRDIVVKEGQQVTRGQKIAEMGNTDADQVKLHFEIRRLGKPMDPAKYLPPG